MHTPKILAALLGLSLLAACSGPASDTGGAANGSGADMSANGSGAGLGAGAGAGRAVPGSEEDLVQNVGDRVLFATDSSTLAPDAQALLARQAAWLKTNSGVAVQIAGNCDERGTEEYNLALGQRRAVAARDYLATQGIARQRMTAISYGKDRPTALGSDPQSWAQNRNAITSVQ